VEWDGFSGDSSAAPHWEIVSEVPESDEEEARMDISLFTSFEGRINRAKWWLGVVVLLVIEWIVAAVFGMGFGRNMMTMGPEDMAAMEQALSAMWLPLVIIGLIFLWPTLAVYVKRWHDRGKSGWWTLIGLVPVIGGIWILVELGCLAGTDGPNQYGPDPLAS
jgi:uncharacterized membrane protein YhaH (DUF805 family)